MTDTTTAPQDASETDQEVMDLLLGMMDVEQNNTRRLETAIEAILEQGMTIGHDLSYAVSLTPMVMPEQGGGQQIRPVYFIALTLVTDSGQEYSGNLTIGVLRPSYESLAQEVTKMVQGLLQAVSSPLVVPQPSGLILPDGHGH